MSKHDGRISGRQLAARLQEATESHAAAHRSVSEAMGALVVPLRASEAQNAAEAVQEGDQQP